MSYNVLRANNAMETIIDDNCGISKFYAIATSLCDELHVTFLGQADDGDTLAWDFVYQDTSLTLHFDVYGGVSIIQNEERNGRFTVGKELGAWLHGRAF